MKRCFGAPGRAWLPAWFILRWSGNTLHAPHRFAYSNVTESDPNVAIVGRHVESMKGSSPWSSTGRGTSVEQWCRGTQSRAGSGAALSPSPHELLVSHILWNAGAREAWFRCAHSGEILRGWPRCTGSLWQFVRVPVAATLTIVCDLNVPPGASPPLPLSSGVSGVKCFEGGEVVVWFGFVPRGQWKRCLSEKSGALMKTTEFLFGLCSNLQT